MSKDRSRRPHEAADDTQSRSCARRHASGEPVRGEVACRRAGQDRPRQSADRHLCRAWQERTDRRATRGRADQRQERHSRPQGRYAGRGFDQRRRRDRGAEGEQADRPRQGQLPARQHQLGAGAGDGEHQLREEGVPHRARRPHRLRHRHAVPLERVPRLQHDAHGDQFGLQAAAHKLRQEVVLHHDRLRLRPLAAGRASRRA